MNNKDILKEIIHKFKLDRPLPSEVQKEMIEAKKYTLIAILKRFGKYTYFIMPVIWLYFQVKKFGLVLTFAKSAYIVIAAILILVSVISVGSYAAVRYMFMPEAVKNEAVRDIKTNIPLQVKKMKTPAEKNKIVAIQYKLGIMPFVYYDDNRQLSAHVMQIIRNNLLHIKGNNAAVCVSNTNKITTPNVLVGSIVKFAEMYNITVKMVDSHNSRVLFYTSEKAQSKADIEKVCQAIALKIARML